MAKVKAFGKSGGGKSAGMKGIVQTPMGKSMAPVKKAK